MIQPISRFMAKTTLYHGPGAAKLTGGEAVKLGLNKVLLVTGKHVRKAGLTGVVEESLRENKIAYEVFDDVPEDADVQTCHKIAVKLREGGCNGAVVVGGGSPICAAKGGVLEATNKINSVEEVRGPNNYKVPPLPLICVPTTAGSGSDVSAGFPILRADRQSEFSISGDHIQPPVSILDPLMLKTCPTRAMIYAGLDALSHAVDALWGTRGTPLTDALAFGAIQVIMNNLRAAALTDDMEARSQLHLASSFANYACGNASMGVIHGIAVCVGSLKGSHGFKCGVLIPYGIEFNMPVCEDKFARMAAILGEKGETQRELAEAFLWRVQELLLDLDFPDRFGPENLKPEGIPALVKEARSHTPGFLDTNLRKITDEDIEYVAQRSLEGWETEET